MSRVWWEHRLRARTVQKPARAKPLGAPTPWSYDRSDECVRDNSDQVIGRFEPRSGPLAAAAPDLYKALKDVVDFDGGASEWEEVCEYARETLRAARSHK